MAENYDIKIHDQLYVGFQRDGTNMPTGHMCNYAETKANQKIRDNITYLTSYGLGGKEPLNAIMIDNKPLPGFRISRNQINNGWHQTPSHIRVEDPRGFEVAITIQNMIMLTNMNALHDGEIMQDCIWGRDNGVNVLLPVNSEPYKEAITNTDRLTTHVHVSKLTPGDHVILKNGQAGRYMGKLSEISDEYKYIDYGQSASTSYYGYRSEFRPTVISMGLRQDVALHYIEQTSNDRHGNPQLVYTGYASPNVSRIVKSETLTIAEVNERLATAISNQYPISGKHSVIKHLIHGKAEIKDIHFVEITADEADKRIKAAGYRRSEFCNQVFGTTDKLPNTRICITDRDIKSGKAIDYSILTETQETGTYKTTGVQNSSLMLEDIKFETVAYTVSAVKYDYTFKVPNE